MLDLAVLTGLKVIAAPPEGHGDICGAVKVNPVLRRRLRPVRECVKMKHEPSLEIRALCWFEKHKKLPFLFSFFFGCHGRRQNRRFNSSSHTDRKFKHGQASHAT